MLGKLGSAHRHSSVFKPAVGTFIALLLCLSGPSAVLFAIPGVVVDSVNGVEHRRTFPHISDKILEDVPLLAHGYVSLSIPSGFQRLIAGGTSAHVLPAPVSPALHPSPSGLGLSVGRFGFADHLPHLASARLGSALAQDRPIHRLLDSAHASAKPVDVAVNIVMGFSEDNKVSKGCSGQIFGVGVKRLFRFCLPEPWWRVINVLVRHAHNRSMGRCSSGGQPLKRSDSRVPSTAQTFAFQPI